MLARRLRPREWLLLLHLALARRAVTRTELLRAFGLGIDPGTNVVAVQVSRLRAELARAGRLSWWRRWRAVTVCGHSTAWLRPPRLPGKEESPR